jgi:isopenicillin N synthase-like dioxygenase
MKIPIVDVAPLFGSDPEGWRSVEHALQAAHSTIGFSVLVNHGVPAAVMRDLFAASASFHALPLEQKMSLRYGANLRGYLPLHTSTLVRSTLGSARKPNHSDSFVILDELHESLRERWSRSAMGGDPLWPREIAGFEASASRYREAMQRLGMATIRCFSGMLGLPVDGLDRHFERPNRVLRLLHYPPLPDREPDVFGSAPHTDYGCLTFVAQDDVGGLQVQSSDGKWCDVPAIADSLVLNTGQILSAWSGGRIKATPHRVINHSARERYSIAFFFDCALDTPVDLFLPPREAAPPAGTSSERTYGERLEAILRANYSFAG